MGPAIHGTDAAAGVRAGGAPPDPRPGHFLGRLKAWRTSAM